MWEKLNQIDGDAVFATAEFSTPKMQDSSLEIGAQIEENRLVLLQNKNDVKQN